MNKIKIEIDKDGTASFVLFPYPANAFSYGSCLALFWVSDERFDYIFEYLESEADLGNLERNGYCFKLTQKIRYPEYACQLVERIL